MPFLKTSTSRNKYDDFDIDADTRRRRRDRHRECSSDILRDNDRRKPVRERDDDVQKERVDELIRLLQKKSRNGDRDRRDDSDDSTTECEIDYDKVKDEEKLDRAADAIQANKGNYYANTRRLWELDREITKYVRDPEAKRLLNEKMKRTIQYFLDTYLFSKTSDPMRHLDNFCAKYNFIE